ncbi:Hypothetical protein Cul210932_2286 [Corynebacterium ulcerans]|nr:Hypothetical protein Cul210932_2286 [Corynebacterium ulcerans]
MIMPVSPPLYTPCVEDADPLLLGKPQHTETSTQIFSHAE